MRGNPANEERRLQKLGSEGKGNQSKQNTNRLHRMDSMGNMAFHPKSWATWDTEFTVLLVS